ncbi:tetratricopeptide repeat protein, partial [Candidatus Neomarinimicrobiota bacterium]
ITSAVDYLEQAVAIDPNFAQAYAALVPGYFSLDWLAVISSREARSKARTAIERALELDDTHPNTQTYLGFYLYMYGWDWTEAERAFKRAIELAPNYVQAHLEYGLFLGKMGRLDEALFEMQRVKELDPLFIYADFGFGEVYLYNRQYEKAIEYLIKVLELEPGNFTARVLLASTYTANSMHAEAIEEYEKLASRPGLLLAQYAMGRETEALAYFDSLKASGEILESNFTVVAIWYSSLGDREVALYLLERAYEERSWDIWVMLTSAAFDSLRAEPRFKAIVEKLGLPEVFDQYGQRIRYLPDP